MEWIIALGVISGIVVLYFISVFNRIIRYSVKIEEAFSNIDVALSKRYHVISQLFDIAKSYAKYERETLYQVVEARNKRNVQEMGVLEGVLNHEEQRLLVLQEQYPDLKADQLFLNLQHAAQDAEEHLQAARRLYNSNIALYNQRIQSFPGLLIANRMKTSQYEMYKVVPFEAKGVKIEF